MLNKLTKSFVLIAVLLSGANLYADERTQALIETRQGLLKVMGFYIGPMVAMARQQAPYDADVVKANATKMAELAGMIPDVFRVDTSGSDLESESLDKIWSNTDDFNAKAANLAEKAAALAASTEAGQSAFMGAFGATGGTCKSCHDDYRIQK